MLMFYNAQTTNLTFVGERTRYTSFNVLIQVKHKPGAAFCHAQGVGSWKQWKPKEMISRFCAYVLSQMARQL